MEGTAATGKRQNSPKTVHIETHVGNKTEKQKKSAALIHVLVHPRFVLLIAPSIVRLIFATFGWVFCIVEQFFDISLRSIHIWSLTNNHCLWIGGSFTGDVDSAFEVGLNV